MSGTRLGVRARLFGLASTVSVIDEAMSRDAAKDAVLALVGGGV
jgi:hypothetical protein